MLEYNQIKPREYIVLDSEPYEVLENHVIKKNRGKPSNNTKLKSLKTGKVIEKTFHASDKVAQAEIYERDIKFLYRKRDEIWFADAYDPRDRFMLEEQIIKDALPYLKENDVVKGVYFGNEIINIKIPIKVTLEVVEAPDAVKGNTSSGATKEVVLENGLRLFVPLFISVGDKLVINTQKGEYSERER
ncbi:MAG: elongation factor P [Patescibacteria group bacterium]